MNNYKSIDAPEVAAVFATYPRQVLENLLYLRKLILETAKTIPGVGPLEETLKWGQPAYLTAQSKSGSTIRIAATKSGNPGDYAMYFICTTKLVDEFKEMFGNTFTYEGNRALVFNLDDPVPKKELQTCIALALSYHKKKGSLQS